jgi:hypothetical protein
MSGAIMKRKIITPGLFLTMAALAAGCAGGARHSLVPDYPSRSLRSVAVLPVLNETVSLKAPEAFRPILQQKLSHKGYEAPPIFYIDQRLLQKEIREAGQIHTLTPQEMGKVLGVDGLLYATVTEFSTTYLLAYASMTVAARFELKDAKTGELLWDSDNQVKDAKLAVDPKSMQETAQFAIFQAYMPYVQKVVDASFATLPNGPRAAAPPPARGCLFPGRGK